MKPEHPNNASPWRSPWAPWTRPLALALSSAGLLAGCALQPRASTPLPPAPAEWAEAPTATTAATAGTTSANDLWWQALPDPALAPLMAAAEAGSPTLALAAARIDEARAQVSSAGAATLPQAQGSLGGSRGNSSSTTGAPQTVGTASLNLSWELDLFGRLAANSAAAQARLDARSADARATRLSLQASLASTVLGRRACGELLAAQVQDVGSREATLALTERKLAAGLAPEVDRSRVQSGLAEARGQVAATQLQCRQLSHSLVALSTLPWREVDVLFATPTPLPAPPPLALNLPATVLATHPSLQTAVKTADAAYEDLGAARAARLPSLSLSALLGRQWIGLGGSTLGLNQWSLGASLAGAVLDGGAGAANVDAARARYAQALAQLQSTLLTTVQEVEDALSQLASAQARDEQAQAGVAAAQRLFDATDANWRAGRTSLFELEDARRTLQSARSSLITARRDRAQAWVALVKASGLGWTGV